MVNQWICGKCGENAHAHSLSTSECIWEPVDPADLGARIREFLSELGLSEGEGYEVYGDGGNLQFSVSIPDPRRELPEELKPYDLTEYEVERAVYSSEKNSHNGVRFERALTSYAHVLFHGLPEVQELEATLEGITESKGFREYDRKRLELWNGMISSNPRLQELEAELETLY